MKNLLKNLLLLTLLLSPLSAQRHNVERVSLQLSWQNQFQFAGYYMAKEKGFYDDVHLDVQIKEYQGVEAVQEVLKGDATYGIGYSSLIADIANGAELQMLNTVFQTSPFVFVTLKDSNISTIKDFKNKKIMITDDLASSVSLQALLNKNSLFLKDMQRQTPVNKLESLIQKKTDIMASYISNEPYLLQDRGVEVRVIDPKDEGFDFYSDILFTSKEELLHHKRRALHFSKASLKGWEYAFSHVEETVELILKKYNTQNKSKAALLYEANTLKKFAYQGSTPLGEIQDDKLQRIYDIYNVMGVIKKDIMIDKLYFSPKEELLTEEEQNYLQEKKVIKMCINPNWMPFEKLDNGHYIGISADYMQLIQTMIKTKIELVKTEDWSESLEYAKKRKCDILSLSMKNRERKKYLNFTQSYLELSVVIATKIDVPFIKNFKKLKKKKVGVTKGFALIQRLQEKYPDLEIIEVENSAQGLEKTSRGELFCYVGSLADIGYILQQKYIGELKVSGKFETKLVPSIAVRDDDPMLLEILNKALSSIDKNQREKIENRWITIKTDSSENYAYLWWILGVLTSVLTLSLVLLVRQREINRIMADQASRDYMTKLYNRRYFMDAAESILELTRRDKSKLSVIMIDIDDFKHINDTYGHQAGDETIIAVAQAMKEQSRRSDMIARWGGEEFLILLPQTDVEGASVIAEKIRLRVKELEINTSAKQCLHVSISLGVSNVCLQTDINIDAAADRADKALYMAKESGKDRVCANIEELSI